MVKMTGSATMYMRMPMSTSSLPIAGDCSVDDKKLTLKFPFTGIEFDLPSAPKDINDVSDTFKLEFKIRTSSGSIMVVEIGYVSDLKCFTGRGYQEEDSQPCLNFHFYRDSSPMAKLPKL